MIYSNIYRSLFTLLISGVFTMLSYGQCIVYPEHSSIIDITQAPYYADNSGVTDVSVILQQAIDDNTPGGWKIIYFPKGIYRVSKTIKWSENSWSQGPVFQGYHTDSTIIQLIDNAPTFGVEVIPVPVLWTGEKVAQKFDRGIRNLTVNIGSGNPGAVGIQFFSNNEGILSDVKIISGDGYGNCGLDMGLGGENGPLLVRNLYVYGFQTGIRVNALNSVTMSNIHIEGQKTEGIRNTNHVCSIENLYSNNSVPAVINNSGGSTLTLINSVLDGGAADNVAITNQGNLFLRNIHTNGYKKALENTGGIGENPDDSNISEFSSYGVTSLFENSGKSLNLEIEQSPKVPWEYDMNQWVNIQDYGAIPDDGTDDGPAIQAAIDAGKTTVFIPNNGNYQLHSEVLIRGKVNRLTGINAWMEGNGKFILKDGEAPVVIVEKIRRRNPNQTFGIENNSPRTLLLEATIFHYTKAIGSGNIFLNDCLGKIITTSPEQKIWARHHNTENPGDTEYNIKNDKGSVWILGLKTESFGIKSWVLNGGKTEILGAHIYPQCTEKLTPMMRVDNAYYSGACIRETNFCNKDWPSYYTQYVIEKRGEITDTLFHDDAPARGQGSGNAYSLYLSSNDGLLTPASPINLSYTVIGQNQISLNWESTGENTSSFIVLKKQDGLFLSIDTIGNDEREYTDQGLDPDLVYAYYIRAINGEGLTTQSNIIRFRINDPVSESSNIQQNIFDAVLYPNPANANVFLKITGVPEILFIVKVFNTAGKEIMNKQFISGHADIIDLNDYNKGLYLVNISNNNLCINKKLVLL